MKNEPLTDLNPREQALSIPSITSGGAIEKIDTIEPDVIWWYLEEILHSNKIGARRKIRALERTFTYYWTDYTKSDILLNSLAYLRREAT